MENESFKYTTWLNIKKKNVTQQIQIQILKNRTQLLNQLNQVPLPLQKPYLPTFLIIHSEKEVDTISSLSPFVVHKTIMSIAGEQKSVENLRSGVLLIQFGKESYENKSSTDENVLWSNVLRDTPFTLEHIQGYYLLSNLEQSDKR